MRPQLPRCLQAAVRAVHKRREHECLAPAHACLACMHACILCAACVVRCAAKPHPFQRHGTCQAAVTRAWLRTIIAHSCTFPMTPLRCARSVLATIASTPVGLCVPCTGYPCSLVCACVPALPAVLKPGPRCVLPPLCATLLDYTSCLLW